MTRYLTMASAMIVVGLVAAASRLMAAEAPQPNGTFTPQRLEVPAGFAVELAAGPPLVEHPTFATFDDRGRLFVCENAGVNMSAQELEANLPNSIRLLEDSDHDGRFDKSTVFADKLTFPMGGAWCNGSLYVASPPHIWRLTDTDGDGVADRRDALVGKFGYTGNAASIHGCVLGPDGRLYWCDGFHGHEFKDAAGRVTSKRVGSYIFSCLPDGSDVRIHCGGGMDNPVEVDFTSEGELLGTVNIMYTRPRVDCFVHWQYGGAYPHNEKVLPEIKITGDLLGPVHRFGHVAPAGAVRYRSGALDRRWRDNYFAAHFNSGKVVRLELQRAGATFSAEQREFLSCPSHDFHPTDVAEDADGSLLIVDTGGWFYRGCPTSQFAKPDVLGAIYRVRREQAAAPEDPRGLHIDWAKQSFDQLVRLLGDTRFAVRERAIARCAQHGEAIVPLLRQTLEHRDRLPRLGSLWALTRIIGDSKVASTTLPPAAVAVRRTATAQAAGSNELALFGAARAAIRTALDDADSSVRLAACRSIATYPDPAAKDRLLKLLQSDQPPIRRDAAAALGRIGDAGAVPALLKALARAGSGRPTKPAAGTAATHSAESETRAAEPPQSTMDRAENHAIVYALIEINNASATRAGLVAANVNTRRGALLALDQMDGSDLTADDVAPLAAAEDVDLQRAAAEVFSRRADWRSRAAEVIGRLLNHPASIDQNAAVIRKLTTRSLDDSSVGKLVGGLLGDAKTPDTTRDLLLAAIADGQGVPLHESWVEPLERLLGESSRRAGEGPGPQASQLPLRTLERALAAITAIKTDRFRNRLNQLGADDSLPALVRAAALDAASRQRGKLSDSSLSLLLGALDGGPRESLEAAQRIGGMGLSKPQLIRLAPKLASAGPSQLQELLHPFQRTQDADVAKALLAAAEDARSLTSLNPPQFSDVIKSFPRELLPAANKLLDRIRQEEEKKLARLDALLPQLERGNAERGRTLFFAEKSKCATCHRVANEGGRIGPDLTTIGANRASRDLLESIVFPSATIVRNYEPYIVSTAGGRTLAGLIARETRDTLFIQQQTGDPVAVARSEIDEIVPSSISIMPNGLEQSIAEAELADIIAYLTSLEQPPRAPDRSSTATDPRQR